MWTLLRYDTTPPGGYIFTQTEGISHSWPFSVELEKRAREISDFRTANNLPRPGYEESLVDLIQFTCQRLGGMGCVDTSKTYAETVPAIRRMTSGSCGSCGAKVKK